MNLHEVHQDVTTNRKRKRVGRGPGSGHGKTSTRGHKGQRSRTGHSQNAVFQGGTMPLVRRVPKRGFNNKFALKIGEVNLRDLEERFENGEEVTPESLKERNLASQRYDELKILGTGDLTKKLKVSAHRFSKSAKEKIEKAGGEVTLLQRIVTVEEKKEKKRAESGKGKPGSSKPGKPSPEAKSKPVADKQPEPKNDAEADGPAAGKTE